MEDSPTTQNLHLLYSTIVLNNTLQLLIYQSLSHFYKVGFVLLHDQTVQGTIEILLQAPEQLKLP